MLLAIVRQLVEPAVIGVATGACVALANGLIEGWCLGHLAALPGAWPALFSPLALILPWLATRYVTRAESPATAELYVRTYHEPGAWVPLRQLPGRLLAAAGTVAPGGSQGLESASVLIGAAWGRLLAPRGPGASDDWRRTCLAAGASAGIAAVFSSPAMGTLYGFEVPYRRDADVPRLPPCAVAAVCSYFTRAALAGPVSLVGDVGPLTLDAALLAGCLAVAVLCGLGARLFAHAAVGLHRLAHRTPRPARALAAGAVLAVLAWAGYALTGAWITFGPGYIAAGWAQEHAHPLGLFAAAFAIRVAGNLVCVYGGGGGGVFTSLACNGLFIGLAVAEAVGHPQSRLLALVGAACFLSSGYRLPLACVLFVAEAGGSLPATALGLVAIATGQVLMGDASVSDAQVDCRPDALSPPAEKRLREAE